MISQEDGGEPRVCECLAPLLGDSADSVALVDKVQTGQLQLQHLLLHAAPTDPVCRYLSMLAKSEERRRWGVACLAPFAVAAALKPKKALMAIVSQFAGGGENIAATAVKVRQTSHATLAGL